MMVFLFQKNILISVGFEKRLPFIEGGELFKIDRFFYVIVSATITRLLAILQYF